MPIVELLCLLQEQHRPEASREDSHRDQASQGKHAEIILFFLLCITSFPLFSVYLYIYYPYIYLSAYLSYDLHEQNGAMFSDTVRFLRPPRHLPVQPEGARASQPPRQRGLQVQVSELHVR